MKSQLVELDGKEEQSADAPLPETLAGNLKRRIADLEVQAHNQHSIAPEVIDAIIEQAAKRSVQQVAALLRKVADLLDVLEK